MHEDGATFRWQHVLRDALYRLRSAILRVAHGMKRHHIGREHTNLTGTIPEAERRRYEPLARIGARGDFTLTSTLTQEITNAETAVNALYGH